MGRAGTHAGQRWSRPWSRGQAQRARQQPSWEARPHTSSPALYPRISSSFFPKHQSILRLHWYNTLWYQEKERATHSSVLAWKIPWMEEPTGLQSTGSQSRTRLSHFTFFSFCRSFWRRKGQPTPVFLPGESHGRRGLVGYSLWGCKESETPKQLTNAHMIWNTTLISLRVACYIILMFSH